MGCGAAGPRAWWGTVSVRCADMRGEYGGAPWIWSVDEIERLLAGGGGADWWRWGTAQGRVLAHTHLQHALQTAALLAAACPDDAELGGGRPCGERPRASAAHGAVDETPRRGRCGGGAHGVGGAVARLVGLHVAYVQALLGGGEVVRAGAVGRQHVIDDASGRADVGGGAGGVPNAFAAGGRCRAAAPGRRCGEGQRVL